MVRIGGSTERGAHIHESDYFTPQGEFRVDREGSSTLLNCLMYKMSYYRFGEVYTERGERQESGCVCPQASVIHVLSRVGCNQSHFTACHTHIYVCVCVCPQASVIHVLSRVGCNQSHFTACHTHTYMYVCVCVTTSFCNTRSVSCRLQSVTFHCVSHTYIYICMCVPTSFCNTRSVSCRLQSVTFHCVSHTHTHICMYVCVCAHKLL